MKDASRKAMVALQLLKAEDTRSLETAANEILGLTLTCSKVFAHIRPLPNPRNLHVRASA